MSARNVVLPMGDTMNTRAWLIDVWAEITCRLDNLLHADGHTLVFTAICEKEIDARRIKFWIETSALTALTVFGDRSHSSSDDALREAFVTLRKRHAINAQMVLAMLHERDDAVELWWQDSYQSETRRFDFDRRFHVSFGADRRELCDVLEEAVSTLLMRARVNMPTLRVANEHTRRRRDT